MADLKWTVESLDWLEDIYRYIAEDSPSAAARVVEILGVFHGALDIDRYMP